MDDSDDDEELLAISPVSTPGGQPPQLDDTGVLVDRRTQGRKVTARMEGKVAVVTGASRGIGAAVARAFSQAGASVALAARDASALDRLSDELGGRGRALAVPTDVTDVGQVASLAERVVDEFGRLDLACNNAAASGHQLLPLADVPVDAFDSELAVSLRGVFLAMRAEIPVMLDTGGGAIVNVSSTAGQQGVAGLAAYVSAKHGVEGLTQAAALDYAERGIRVNAVAPGPILTDDLTRAGPQAQRAAAAAMPMRRIGRPEDVAAAVLWLCSDDAAFITGTTVVIDGGKLAGTPPFMTQRRPE
jgi:NAD(P)-dependent dehydrogenase (short-subunit alcohol dehydrogenase family)